MSHEIQEHDKQEGRAMAWHSLTMVNPELALNNCHLNGWDYVAKPVTVEGQATPFCVLGTTDVEGLLIGRPYIAKSFKPLTNARLIQELTDAIGKQGLTLESCGTIMNRGRQFFSFSMDAAKFQAAGRPFKSFLNIGNGNDMSCPLWVNTSNICTVCNNTFTANLGSEGMIMRVKKTQFSDFKVSELGAAVQGMMRGQAKFAKELNILAEIICTEHQAKALFAGYIGEPGKALTTGASNTVEELMRLFKTGDGNNGDDMADAFSAFTDFYTHQAASGKDDAGAKWKNHISSEFGAGKTHKAKVWELITDPAKRDGLLAIGNQILTAKPVTTS